MKPARWAVLGALLGALGTTAWQLPARWLVPALEQASGHRLLLGDVRGTLWNGSAAVRLSGGPGSRDLQALAGRTAWRLRLSTTVGRGWWPALALAVDQDCCLRQTLHAELAPSTGGIAVRLGALDWQGPAQLMQGLGTPWNTLAFDGALQLSASQLQLHRQDGSLQLEGRLSLIAQTVSSAISTLSPLGSYRIDLEGRRAQPLRLSLSTLSGPLRLSGEGARTLGHWRFRGEARAAPGQQVALAPVLGLIGNREGPVALRVLR